MAKIHADRIPGFLDALARERTVREGCFLGHVEPILGVELVPLTLERLNLLILAGNRYLCGGDPKLGDVLQFLWFASRGFSFERGPRQKFIRRYSADVLARYAEANAAIRDYLADAMIDVELPGQKAVHEPIAAWIAQHVFVVAQETGWSRDSIYRELPFAEVMQYVRLAEKYRGSPVTNPFSNELKMRWLEGLNSPAATRN